MTRPTWDDYFLQIAKAVATRADCTRRQVGAVIVSEDHRIISTGYNGGPSGGPSCLAGQCPRGWSEVAPGSSYDTGPGTCIALHAEQNAIVYATFRELRGATLYVTAWPCDGCKRLISGVGIERVVCPDEESIPEYNGPRRDDQVATWLKRWRDIFPATDSRWYTLDALLDNYRLHADTGTQLG